MNTGRQPAGIAQTWPAPAKLNLFLHITGRRNDGYHLLQTAIQFVDICDLLNFRIRDDGVIRCVNSDRSISSDSDLAVQAARLLQDACSMGYGADIHLEKVIPKGSGLGGGSSDAATVLLALNKLWNCGLDRRRLEKLGSQLGADVPVFIRGKASWVEGVGEPLHAVNLPEAWYVIVYPGVHLDTRQMFADPSLQRDCAPVLSRDFSLREAGNVFEPIARRHAQVERAWQWLSQHLQVRLTGSGSCLFACGQSRSQVEEIAADCPSDFTVFVAKGMNHSPACSISQYN